MKLKPLVEALGMNPAWWMHRFTFISKQVWYDEKVSRLRFDATQLRLRNEQEAKPNS